MNRVIFHKNLSSNRASSLSSYSNNNNLYNLITSKENLLVSWQEFRVGKKNKHDVQIFEHSLAENLFALYEELKSKTYRHGYYSSFYIHDPKLRHIHKAGVRDRVLHHAIMRMIEPIFEKTFIFDSYSSRKGKGTHRAIFKLRDFAWKLSKNNTKTVWALKCDIRKFFDSIDHQILFQQIQKRITDQEVLWLLGEIIESYPTNLDLPIGRRGQIERERERERERDRSSARQSNQPIVF